MKNIILLAIVSLFSSFHLLKAQSGDSICIAIQETDNSLLSVFPNPSDGTFQITYASTTSCPPPGWGGLIMINIINENGKIIYTESVNDFEGEYSRTIDLTDQQKGTYIIEVVAGNQKRVKREVLK